jgi:hypothetical protein
MKKIVKNTFIILLLSLLSALVYVSTIGIETEKFNSKISSQIKQLNSNLDIKLNQVNIKIDLFSFQIIAKTIGADLIYEDRILEIQNIKSKISLKSLIEKRFSLSEILISTKSLKIKDLITFVRILENDPKLLIAEQFIKNGYVVADIKLEFDESGNIQKNFNIKGLISDGKISFLNKYDLNKINLIFEVEKEKFKFNDINLSLNNKSILLPALFIEKKSKEYLVSGKLNNQNIKLNKNEIKNYIKNELFNSNIQEISFSSENNFSFKINKKFDLKDLDIKSEITLNDLKFKNYLKLKDIFPKIKKDALIQNHKIKLNYNKKILNIVGSGKFFLQNEFDLIKYEITKKKDEISYNTSLNISENSLYLGIINYEKKKNTDLKIKIKATQILKKKIIFDEISLKENNNIIHIEDLVLSNDNKISEIKKIKIDFLDKENIKNKIQLNKKKNLYLIEGQVFNINNIITNLLNDNKKNKVKIFDKDIKFNFNIEKIHLDKKNVVNNLSGHLNLVQNEISELDLVSNFSNQKIIKFIIKKNDFEKITTIFSDEAKPLVDRYKFIKGFNEGILDFYSSEKNGVSTSKLKIYDFKLKELPVLTKVLTLASLQGIADLLSGEGIRFNELEMNFKNKSNLMTIDEIYAIGPAISILMNGYIEKNKLISLRGTLVPATTINKTIGSIPILGDILVGKKTGEGVFGVSFKIKGPADNLETTVNPVKTLTPRFITRTLEKLKKIKQD